MANIEKQIITHRDIRQGIELGMDPDCIGAYTLQEGIKKTFLSNPYLEDDSTLMVAFTRVDGSIWGRCMYFPTKIKIADFIESSLGGSSLLVNEEGRKISLGADLMMLPMQIPCNKYLLFAGISTMAQPLYKKLRYEIFEMPRRWQIRSFRPILQSIGLKGLVLSAVTSFSNFFLKAFNGVSKFIMRNSFRKYEIRKLDEVPDWVPQMAIDDNHKYAEYHDKKWFEWVLNNSFFENKNDVQSLYGIYKDNMPVGFVLITERQSSIEERNIDRITFGSLIEWGIRSNGLIDEYLIQKIALSLYSPNVDIAQVVSSDNNVINRFGKYAIVNHGSANIVFKDLTKQLDKDYKKSENWRLRVGYSDVPFY